MKITIDKKEIKLKLSIPLKVQITKFLDRIKSILAKIRKVIRNWALRGVDIIKNEIHRQTRIHAKTNINVYNSIRKDWR